MEKISYLDTAKNISDKIVNDLFPEEMSYFQIFWGIFKEYLNKWRDIDPDEWPIKVSYQKISKDIAITNISEIISLNGPKIALIISAVLVKIAEKYDFSINKENKELMSIIEKYGNKFKASPPLIKHLQNRIPELVDLKNIEDLREEGKVEESKPKAIRDEDTLEIGISEGKPYVQINGREVRQFRTKYKQFANLVLLAVARKKDNGWIDKEKLDLGQNDQALSDIRGWIAPSLINDISPKDVIKASTEFEGRIRIEAFYQKNIMVNKSICEFRTKSEKRVENLVNQANKRTLMWEKGIRENLLNSGECEQLDRESEIMRKQMKLVQEGVEKMGWEIDNKRWESLWSISEEILEKCKHKRKYY